MMKKIIVPLAGVIATALLATSCGSGVGSGNVTLKTPADSAAYALGILNGDGFRDNIATVPGDSLDINILLNGFVKGMKKEKTQMTLEDANTFMQTYFQRAIQMAAEKNLKEGEEFLAKNAKEDGVQTTESGLQYKVEKMGDGAKATSENDTVVVHYKGTLLNGKQFDSSYDREEPATFPLTHVIAGWKEGLQLVPAGSKFTLWVPGNLAYGEQGAGGMIGPNQTLKFECELLEVKPAVAVAE